MSKLILCDIDGCLLDWLTPFRSWMHEIGFVTSGDENSYDLHTSYGLDEDQMMEMITAFNKSENAEYLPEFRDSKEYVGKLREAGYEFTAITAFGNNKYDEERRRFNLEQVFGAGSFKQVFALPLRASKIPTLEQFSMVDPKPWWIEDHVKNAKDGASLGFKTILLEHFHNKNQGSDLFVAETWKQIYQHIVGSDDN